MKYEQLSLFNLQSEFTVEVVEDDKLKDVWDDIVGPEPPIDLKA